MSSKLRLHSIILFVGCFIGAVAVPTISSGVYPVQGIGEDLLYEDLEPLKSIIGSASHVGLGETIHTSAGYYQAKVRLIKFLVEETGFRAIAFETPWGEGEAATEYVATCQGTSEAAVHGLFKVWRDVSVARLLKWLCE